MRILCITKRLSSGVQGGERAGVQGAGQGRGIPTLQKSVLSLCSLVIV